MLEPAGATPSEVASLRLAWSFALDCFRPRRRLTRVVQVGSVGIGGTNPIRVQSMTVADTLDTATVVDEICALHAAGCEIVRVTAPNRSSAENLAVIKQALARRGVRVPLVADIHFTPQAALIAALHVEKVRVNPGNYADRKHFVQREYSDDEYAAELARLEAAFRPLVLRCKERGVAMRLGTNHGSLSDRILNRYGDTPLGMVESALEFVRICEHHGYRDLVLSMKASDVKVMIQAYRLLALRMRELGMDYPFHLGVTEAGAGLAARVKSAAGIGSLLADGIGDTIRVSLTEDSIHELPVARAILRIAALPAGEMAASTSPVVPPWDPLQFARRHVQSLGTGSTALAADRPPRIEVVMPASALAGSSSLQLPLAAGSMALAAVPGPDLVLLACNAPDAPQGWKQGRELAALRAAPGTPAGQAFGIEIPLCWLATAVPPDALLGWARLSLVTSDLDELARIHPPTVRLPPLQYTLRLDLEAEGSPAAAATRLHECWESRGWPRGAVALDLPPEAPPETARLVVSAWRGFLAAWPAPPLPPVVLRGRRDPAAVDIHASTGDLEVATRLGALLADGVGDALQLHALDAASVIGGAGRLAAEILQATRLRLTRADFIACPSCGRTQFELQSTTARIEARLRHLEGLKIAVMGCIVNGPGEMADADFGYVGSGPGRIDLYVGKERVERNVPQSEAVERLVDLIRSHGRWVEPGPAGATDRAEPS